MPRKSPRLEQKDDSTEPYRIVSIEVDEELTSLVTARVSNCWFYVEARTGQIRNKKLKDEYNRLASRVLGEKAGQEVVSDSRSKEQEDGVAKCESQVSAKSQKSGDLKIKLSPAETDVAVFLLPAFDPVFRETKRPNVSNSRLTLQDWYAAPITCLSISAPSPRAPLQADRRDDLDGEVFLNETITPHMNLPISLRNISDIPWFTPSDLAVLVESHDIHMPLHPTIVQPCTNGHRKEKYFLKLATEEDETSVTRELKTLVKLEREGLYGNGIRAPELVGLVSLPSHPGSRTQILGFLLSLIPQPARPLLEYMDEEIGQSKRDKWAREAGQMVALLHEHDVVWGDAKGDNFLVDGNDQLWIIDFGGSYTEGWVDKLKAGTKRGDDQGLKKLMNGVKDPEQFLADADDAEHEQQDGAETEKSSAGRKRSRSKDANSPRKRHRREE